MVKNNKENKKVSDKELYLSHRVDEILEGAEEWDSPDPYLVMGCPSCGNVESIFLGKDELDYNYKEKFYVYMHVCIKCKKVIQVAFKPVEAKVIG